MRLRLFAVLLGSAVILAFLVGSGLPFGTTGTTAYASERCFVDDQLALWKWRSSQEQWGELAERMVVYFEIICGGQLSPILDPPDAPPDEPEPIIGGTPPTLEDVLDWLFGDGGGPSSFDPPAPGTALPAPGI